MKFLRTFINNIKPSFVEGGKYNKWFPLFDALENLFFTTSGKTKNPIHVRDGLDIQKLMVTVWLAAFPAMFFGIYNLGNQSLDYLNQINSLNTGDWHHYLVALVGYDHTSFF
jgi:Na+-transporting NADH:ubiquinone oxidoreductase subunit B